MPRPDRLVVVAGTGTEVGKTWVGAAVLRELRGRGLQVAARKPVQSFEPGDRTDADVLAEATGEPVTTVCPSHRWYERALAPPMAAAVLGRPPVLLAELVAELAWPAGVDVGLVETAGGVRSPLAEDGDAVALTASLAPDAVLLVADAGLGTISAVRLATAALSAHRVVVVLNRFDAGDDLHVRNRDWLASRDGVDVVGTPAAAADRLLRG